MGHGGLNLPYDVPANEYLTMSGEQFSKSRGVGIWLPDIVKKFDTDTIRYYLSINMPEKRDTDWNWADYQAKINNELVAVYGNFIHRVLTFIHKNFGRIPPYVKDDEKDAEVMNEVIENFEEVGRSIEKCHFKEGIKRVMRIAQIGNQYMNASEPWRLIKEDVDRCKSVMHTCAKIVKILAVASAPYMPKAADKIWKMLGYKDSIHNYKWEKALEIDENEIGEPIPLFSKVEMKDTMEDPFSKLDLRVAKIIDVKDHPNADRLYVIDVDVGEAGRRRIVAGIKPWYKKEELLGKKIVIITNLKKAKIRGVESEGMLLAVDENGKAVLLIASAKEGSRVYVEGIQPNPDREISYEEFRKVKMLSKGNAIEYRGKLLRDDSDIIKIDRPVKDGYSVK
jgi:methionyl-tRNA synthetase